LLVGGAIWGLWVASNSTAGSKEEVVRQGGAGPTVLTALHPQVAAETLLRAVRETVVFLAALDEAKRQPVSYRLELPKGAEGKARLYLNNCPLFSALAESDKGVWRARLRAPDPVPVEILGRVSIFNEKILPNCPRFALRLKNTTGVSLIRGFVHVLEGGVYAGDAKIDDLQPGEEYLLPYADDLVPVTVKLSRDPPRTTSVTIARGVLSTTTRTRESKAYTITNRNDVERVVLVQHPVRADYKLMDSLRPAETTADFYHFAVKVPAGKTATETITEECTSAASVPLGTQSDDKLRVILGERATSDKVKEALEEAMKLRQKAAATTREILEQDRQLRMLTEDLSRLRANLREMPRNSPAYQRYLEKADKLEAQVKVIAPRLKELQGLEQTQKKAFEDFINTLDVE
jgi:hypothetical protein